MKYLYLDDIRDPSSTGNYMIPVELRAMYRKENWDVVRNYKEFTEWITKNGLPDVISFDHDLAADHYAHPDIWASPEEVQKHIDNLEETGYDCAKWLADYCSQNEKHLPLWYIHSMNPVGAENIKNHLINFLKHQNDKCK